MGGHSGCAETTRFEMKIRLKYTGWQPRAMVRTGLTFTGIHTTRIGLLPRGSRMFAGITKGDSNEEA